MPASGKRLSESLPDAMDQPEKPAPVQAPSDLGDFAIFVPFFPLLKAHPVGMRMRWSATCNLRHHNTYHGACHDRDQNTVHGMQSMWPVLP